MNFEEKRNRLIEDLRERRYISDEKIVKAMKKVPRHLFVPERVREKAYIDRPLSIGKGQTISAPHMVGMLVQKLDLEPSNKVLEIGGGSGYNTAVIAEVLEGGEVISIEKISYLAEKAKENLEKAGYNEKVKMIVGDGSLGYEEKAPYDRILLTAGAPEVPSPLEKQLKESGIIVAPVGGRRRQQLVVGTKKNDKIKYRREGGCVFVPLKGKYGF